MGLSKQVSSVRTEHKDRLPPCLAQCAVKHAGLGLKGFKVRGTTGNVFEHVNRSGSRPQRNPRSLDPPKAHRPLVGLSPYPH